MQNVEMAGVSFVLLALAAGMAFYEWSCIKSKRPLFRGGQIMTLYWITYLSFFVLGITTGIAAIVR
jgi:hypothetical protein